MNAVMRNAYLNSERHEKALDRRQGLFFEYTFWRGRKYQLL